MLGLRAIDTLECWYHARFCSVFPGIRLFMQRVVCGRASADALLFSFDLWPSGSQGLLKDAERVSLTRRCARKVPTLTGV